MEMSNEEKEAGKRLRKWSEFLKKHPDYVKSCLSFGHPMTDVKNVRCVLICSFTSYERQRADNVWDELVANATRDGVVLLVTPHRTPPKAW